MFQTILNYKYQLILPTILILSLFFTTQIIAQKYDFNYIDNDVFPQKYIYDLAQDSNGLLYIATENGLIKYDGYLFEQLTEKDGLAENFIYKIFIDKEKNIWLGHYQKGISLITKFGKIKFIQEKFAGTRITSFVETFEGDIFVSTDYNGIYSIDTNLVYKQLYADNKNKTNNLCVIDNQLLIATSNGLKVVSKIPEKPSYNFDSIYPVFTNENILKIINDTVNNNVLIISANNGIKLIHKKSGHLYFNDYKQFANNISISSACIDQKSNIWFSSNENGLFSYTIKDNKIKQHKHFDSKNGFKYKYTNTLYFDTENNLWIGSYGNGICQLINQEYCLLGQNYFKPDYDITAIESVNNNLYIATKSTVYFIDSLFSVSKLFKRNNQSDITSLFLKNDTLWIGTKKGVYSLSNHFKINKIHFLNDDYINSITGSKNGKIYFATNKGLVIHTKNKFIRFTTNEGMLHNTLKKIFIDKKNKLWIGTVQSPLYFFINDTISIYKHIPGFNSMRINDIAEDNSNNIWLATHGNGIFKLCKDSIQHFTTENGLPSNYCYALYVDSNNTIWSGFQTGICFKNRNDKNFYNLQNNQQFLSNKINSQTITGTKNGKVFFGSEKGLIIYQPDKIKNNKKLIVPQIVNFTINSKPINSTTPIIISHNKNQVFSIFFRAINFKNPKSITYKFRLKNHEIFWHSVSYKIHSTSYSGLSPGKYEFQIMASNHNEYDLNNMVSLKFVIKPPFWKTNWFLISFITLIGIIVLIIIRIREKTLANNQIHLEEQLNIRTNELMIHKNLIEIKNQELTDSINYAQTIQEAILHKNSISDYFPNSFIFFQPKNIVSGDFYWATQIKDEIIIAAVDCTGHGVPGALMSIIGLTFLNEIIKIQNITDPKTILTLLDKKTIEILSSKGEKLSKDGMDIALINFNKKTNKLLFSGAGSPLILIRDGKISKYKGALLGIGDSFVKKFENKEIDIINADKIYIFSDGYKDQFGFITDTKLKNRGFMKILLKASTQEMNKQGYILSKEFLNWRGKNEQTDDVLVIGIEL